MSRDDEDGQGGDGNGHETSRMKKCVGCIAAASLIILSVVPATASPTGLTTFRKLVSVSSAQISPDGKRIAFVRGVRNFPADRFDETLMLVDVAGKAVRALVEARDMSSPAWSADGGRLAYLAKGRNGHDQVFVLSLRGGKPHVATAAKRDVEQFSWSPDGRTIAYVTEDEEPNAAAIVRHDDLFDIHDDGYLTSEAPRPSHIWAVPAAGGRARRLTFGSWSVLETAPPFVGAPTAPSWSHDGSTLAFTRQADADDGDSDRTTIATVDVRTGLVKSLTSHRQYEYQPVFSPAPRTIAYLYPHGPGPISVLDVFASRGAGAGIDVTADLDRDITSVAWMPGGTSLLALGNDGVRTSLWLQGMNGAARRLDLGDLSPSEMSVAKNGTIALVAATPASPSEVYVMSTPAGTPKRLTAFNRFFTRLPPARPQELSWTAPDGQRSDGVLTYPVGFTPGRKYPLVLRIHGGPESASGAAFNSGEGALRYLLASRGYIVFQPNYRGSDNLGSAHEHAIYRDPGQGPSSDVMAGVAAIENMGIVDTSRIAVTGHSYGGYMTAWLISHEHIWRAAVAGDAMVDWKQEYELSAAGNLAWARDSLGGTPQDAASAALYRDGSPITYSHDIRTPTLIISGTADETVPATESYALYHTLRDDRVPVRFVGIPGAHHFPSDPVRIEGYYRVTLDWLARYLR
ncbi:MAG: S9 family peptidase [Candidatus Eremiobacteraeota bacterium]|nr:S9 family peptidase [Candidatus Eremiobacteraeota bacterium]MBC5826173.1 S9 family peptidase [Candidatus Eremiobacteraeota bacterium]